MDFIIILSVLLILLFFMFNIRNYQCSCKEKYTDYNTTFMTDTRIGDNKVYDEMNTQSPENITCYDSEQVDAYKNTDTDRKYDIFVNNAFPKNSFDMRNNAQYDYGWTDNKSNATPKECIQDFRNVQFCAN